MVYANALADNPLDQSPIAAKHPRKKPSIELMLSSVQTGYSRPEDHNKHKNSRYSRGR
ncbi:hypothetical protein SAMN04490202_3593 [Pseudomonas reinekei]|jgi:hypothetical protein|uniref:Uncharacterized protein n=1 Tax=Pseudomonas reinekei TaxID=395598 RepID=A0A1H0RG42_PSERE|nr:hypothetical protein SAMN04490202_3593 [Pseudomonas reinekei]